MTPTLPEVNQNLISWRSEIGKKGVEIIQEIVETEAAGFAELRFATIKEWAHDLIDEERRYPFVKQCPDDEVRVGSLTLPIPTIDMSVLMVQ